MLSFDWHWKYNNTSAYICTFFFLAKQALLVYSLLFHCHIMTIFHIIKYYSKTGFVMYTQYSHGYFLIYLTIPLYFGGTWASLVAQLVNNPPAMQATPVLLLGWDNPLEKGQATHSRILAWRIPWTGAWQATVHEAAKSRTRLCDFHFQKIRKRNI